MELPIVFVLLASALSVVSSYPRNYGAFPKDFYKRQILQPMPGYIPVYIKADDEPVVRMKSDVPRVYLRKPAMNLEETPKLVTKTIAEDKSLKQEKKTAEELQKEVPVVKPREKTGENKNR